MFRFFFVLALLFGGGLFSQEDPANRLKEKGYLFIKGFYSPEQLEHLCLWAEKAQRDAMTLISNANDSGVSLQEIARQFPEFPIVVPERKDPLQVCRTEDLLSCYPDFGCFIQDTLTAYLGGLLGETYVPFKDKLNFKWPGGGSFPYHQDFPAFAVFGPVEHLSVMICIDSATPENGCLQIADNWKETFKDDPRVDQELLSKGKAILEYIEGGPMHGTIVPDLAEKINWVPMITEPGDVIFFSSYIPHFSEENRTCFPRRAMILTFNRLVDGENNIFYYKTKREDPENPIFHFGTPTNARNKGS